MIAEPQLVDSIIAYPDDDNARLVYADWLEEHNEGERAEFIRTQCALENLPITDSRRPDLLAKEQHLLSTYGGVWALPIQHLGARSVVFRRGFVEGIEIDADVFLGAGGLLCQHAPIRDVKVANVEPHLDQFVKSDLLARVRSLDLTLNELGDVGLAKLVSSPHLGELLSLNVAGTGITPVSLSRYSISSVAPKLQQLNLSGNSLDQLDVAGWLDNANFPALRSLGLASTGIDIGTLIHAHPLAQLHELDLSSNEECLDDAAFTQLTACEGLRHLRRLDLCSTFLTDDALPALLTSPWSGLEALHLGSTRVTARGIDVLVQSPLFCHLLLLDLSVTHIGDAGLARLAVPGCASRLVSLDLDYCHITDKGVRFLVESPLYPQLLYLTLSANRIRFASIYELLNSRNRNPHALIDLRRCLLTDGEIEELRAQFGGHVQL
jgi:uncharacterized protein (TIGR02996 family)